MLGIVMIACVLSTGQGKAVENNDDNDVKIKCYNLCLKENTTCEEKCRSQYCRNGCLKSRQDCIQQCMFGN